MIKSPGTPMPVGWSPAWSASVLTLCHVVAGWCYLTGPCRSLALQLFPTVTHPARYLVPLVRGVLDMW